MWPRALRMTRGRLGLMVLLAYLAVLLSITTAWGLAFGVATQAVFILPGVLIVRAVSGPGRGWLIPAAFGPLVGQALSSMALSLLWIAGGRGLWLLAAAPALVTLLIRPAGRLEGRWRLPEAQGSDGMALSALLLLVPLVVGLPFAHVGEITPDGQVYRAYFTADYVWRRAVVAELAKGAFLPVNPFYAYDSLHYYWMPHLMTAVEYRAMGQLIDLNQLLLMRSVFIDAFYIGCLYGVVRMFNIRPWQAAASVASVVLCSSFEGSYAALDYYGKGVPLRDLRSLNIDAVSRWYFQGMPIDGLQRLLFYQPHHEAGYAAGLLGMLAVSHRTRRYDPATLAVSGVLLGASTLLSSFAGLMFTAATALFEGLWVLRQFEWRRAIWHTLAAAVPLACAALCVIGLEYVDKGGSVIRLGLNPQATRRFALVTFLSLGPMILLAGAGALVALWRRRPGLWVLASLVATCGFFYFYVDIRDHQDVYVGWRVGHLMLMASAVLIGMLFERVTALPTATRWTSLAGILIVLAAALPTTAIDIYNTQDITNFGQAPSFKWTLLLTPDELQAFDWIKHNTLPDAVFQVDPKPRDSATWAYLPAFAERRMSVGLPISMIPLAKYQAGSDRMSQMFDADARELYETAVRNHIDYLLVGPPERAAHRGLEQRLQSIPALVRLVFQHGAVSIYQVIPEI